ncbi:minor curlin subunit [Flavobacterium sp. CG_9.1]|uniref:Minor curlin subunit n=1 Tax=Flavobacterium xanthum TaxID=69322 RepID=A0A1M7KE58_9FLAO|nr:MULTISPECIES: hypothetical protein [Flavobacterium]MBG6061149.1 minor curlin subunit [Flavobacterium sp. CG_9.1]SHM63320.1 minor curlin subunit [Flavobacterium xanthum]
MKSISLNIILCLFFFQLVLAQGEPVNYKYDDDNNISLLDKKEATLYISSNSHIVNSRASLNLQLMGSNVQIQQIGNYNSVNSYLKSKIIDISVVQKGNNNEVLLDKQANSLNQKVIQLGNNNKIHDFALYTKYDVTMELIQKGNNQNIQNFGSNSISRDMKVIQSGTGASVIIINSSKQ